MMRFVKFVAPALALGLFAAVPNHVVRADSAPAASQPSATGSVTVKVVDADGNAVTGAKVALLPAAPAHGKKHKHEPAEAGPRPAKGHDHAKSVAEGETDANGIYTFKDIAVGAYRVNAHLKGKGKGHENVTIAEPGAPDAATPVITITLENKAPKAPGDQAPAPAK